MKKISLLITMFCLVLAGMAQKDASPRFADLITSESLKKHLQKLDIKNSVVLVKGSRGMKMEEFVSIIESTKN